MNRRNRIAVVGAGLGGLTCAAFLQREGFTVTVYEQAPAFSRIGAGIILSANVMKVLRRLGIERSLLETGIRPDAFVSRAWNTGETLYELTLDAASEQRFGGPYINVHRGDLHAVLATAVRSGTIAFGHGLAGLQREGQAIRLVFENGARQDADIVIGADGIRSKVRDILLGAEPPRFTGRVAQRAIFPTERLRGHTIRDCTKWWGADRHLLAYFMTRRRDEVYLMGSVPAAAWESEELSLPCPREEFVASFAHFHPDIRRVVEAATEVTVWPICDRERHDCWSGGRIVLLGDACHPVRPYMAAGGAMAVEDAAVLSRCLATIGDDDPADAFQCYEATRVARVGEVQRISIENSWMHGPTETDWFFCYDACLAPLTRPS
ncbi:MAG: FAD-binding protein [Alphaproteobacteria bacterium]|nr:MAG: FAD-binding protein [Alphaproteobacteria bacterium]